MMSSAFMRQTECGCVQPELLAQTRRVPGDMSSCRALGAGLHCKERLNLYNSTLASQFDSVYNMAA